MKLQRWFQLKRIFKLCNNDTAKKIGEEGYNPCYKYDLIYDVITSNTIALTKHGGLDLSADETTWGHQGYGEAGAGVVSRVVGKPRVSRGEADFYRFFIGPCLPVLLPTPSQLYTEMEK